MTVQSVQNAIQRLEKMRDKISHRTCEDTWYNCPCDPEDGEGSEYYDDELHKDSQKCMCMYNERRAEIQTVIDLLKLNSNLEYKIWLKNNKEK